MKFKNSLLIVMIITSLFSCYKDPDAPHAIFLPKPKIDCDSTYKNKNVICVHVFKEDSLHTPIPNYKIAILEKSGSSANWLFSNVKKRIVVKGETDSTGIYSATFVGIPHSINSNVHYEILSGHNENSSSNGYFLIYDKEDRIQQGIGIIDENSRRIYFNYP